MQVHFMAFISSVLRPRSVFTKSQYCEKGATSTGFWSLPYNCPGSDHFDWMELFLIFPAIYMSHLISFKTPIYINRIQQNQRNRKKWATSTGFCSLPYKLSRLWPLSLDRPSQELSNGIYVPFDQFSDPDLYLLDSTKSAKSRKSGNFNWNLQLSI